MVQAIATTGRKCSEDAVALAKWAAEHAGIPYVPRANLSGKALRERYGVDFILVAKQGLLTLSTPSGDLFFHPNMAHLRLKNLRFGSAGTGDRMVEAMDLSRGMSVLDCTLGFGADAIVASFAVGPEGRVTGIESQPLIETVVGYGLAHFKAENWPIQEAMRGIRTVCADAFDYLKEQPDDSVDVVYFDPMFRHPLLESRSLSGNLLTNIFAGGTTNTEWGFLTGYSQHEEFRGPINSYVRYFKDQGYDALYRHPGYSWFYNRSNVNEYLGFDECVFNESGFGDLISIEDALFKSDTVLVDYLLNDIDSRTEDDDPLFLFSVSYQNHGPYSSETYWEEYVTPAKTGWSMESCCVINNYLAGIRSTIEQMRRLTRELEARDEPIVLVLFGDHKPWMGNGSSVYAEMGVDLDVSTQEGFYNYFSTPYLIYANKAARESLGQDFRGDGGDISPCFLMDKLFFECGWTGDGFMQLQRETRAVTPLMHEDGYRMVDGSITLDVPPDVAEICRRYLCAQYYREQHFVSES